VHLQTPTRFQTGWSGELLGLRASWFADEARVERDFVVRIEPMPTYQLFLDTNFEEQFRVIEALHRSTDVPVPGVVGFEPDHALLGGRFFVMEMVAGRTGGVAEPWMAALRPSARDGLWWTGLETMARLHRVDWHGLGLDFLWAPRRGATALEQQLAYYGEYYDWARDGIRSPVIEHAAEWLHHHLPVDVPTSMSWGDARRGNLLFGPDLRCTAMMDFEQVALGPPELDLGWWLVAERRMADAAAVALPSKDATVERYGELLGRPVERIEYFEVLAAYRIAVMHLQLTKLRGSDPGQTHRPDGEATLRELMRVYAGSSSR
jgi:aminoglycoside phosphotransferase (APT) family kinase protein